MFQQTLAVKRRRRTTDKCEVEAGRGKEGVSGKNLENDGEKAISARDVGTFLQWKIEEKEIPTIGRRGNADGNTRSVAAGIASQRILGASEMLP